MKLLSLRYRWIATVCTLAAVLGGFGVAVAQTPAVPPSAAGASDPPVQDTGAIKYLSGGAGDEERQQMQAQADQYPLQIVFSGRNGDYAVADSVSVRNRQGPLLTLKEAGPWLMLNLPPGAYVVAASFKGITQERAVSTGSGAQKIQWATPGS